MKNRKHTGKSYSQLEVQTDKQPYLVEVSLEIFAPIFETNNYEFKEILRNVKPMVESEEEEFEIGNFAWAQINPLDYLPLHPYVANATFNN